jgi:hypothetical protein
MLQFGPMFLLYPDKLRPANRRNIVRLEEVQTEHSGSDWRAGNSSGRAERRLRGDHLPQAIRLRLQLERAEQTPLGHGQCGLLSRFQRRAASCWAPRPVLSWATNLCRLRLST